MAEDEDDRELDAAERALGTLPAGAAPEEVDDAGRRRDWEMRLAPLAGLVAPVPPPDGLLNRIMARLDDRGEEDSEIATSTASTPRILVAEEEGATALALARERRRASRWRGAAFAMALAAAAAILLAVMPLGGRGPALVSVVTATGEAGGGAGTPALVVTLNVPRGRATIRPAGVQQPAIGSYELWYIPHGGAPVSLGVIDVEAPMEVALSAEPGDLAAMSLEPTGGSPTGQPTGPVLFTGTFVRLR